MPPVKPPCTSNKLVNTIQKQLEYYKKEQSDCQKRANQYTLVIKQLEDLLKS